MNVGLIGHDLSMKHEMGERHPETPDRIKAILKELQSQELLPRLKQLSAEAASEEQIGQAHSEKLIQLLKKTSPAPGNPYASIDNDTTMNSFTLEAAYKSAGAAVLAAEQIKTGKLSRVFCNVRPPGHHAERRKSMGFCFFNNAAIAAYALLDRFKRVAILDFDVHHGNGTEDIFLDEERVMLCQTFHHPLYPGTPFKRDDPRIINAPLNAGAGSREFRAAVTELWIPGLIRHKPEVILFSAGFDAHADDPLGGLNFQNEDYAWVVQEILTESQTTAQGRTISLLEGGYDLKATAEATASHVRALLDF